MTLVLRVCIVLFLASPALTGGAMLVAQDQPPAQDTSPSHRSGHFNIGLTIHDYGLSFGNAPRVNGIRLNVQDAELERVNGINITLWKPRQPFTGTVNGLQVGLLPGSVSTRATCCANWATTTAPSTRWSPSVACAWRSNLESLREWVVGF